jgi:hypothetical protein
MLIVSLLLSAHAETSDAVTATGNLRLNATSRPGFVVDFEGRELESGIVLDSRFRTQVDWKVGDWTMQVGGDLLDGQFAGSPWNLEGGVHKYYPEQISVLNASSFNLRAAQIKGRVGSVVVQSGITTSHWGLGLIANDGNHEQLFARTDYGDRVFRTAAITKPIDKMVVMVGGDWVLEDDIGGYTDGHMAYQGLASAQYFASKDNAVGLLSVYRHQTNIENDKTLAGMILDVYAKGLKPVGDGELYGAIEGVYLHGDHGQISNRMNPEGLDVRSYGVVGQMAMRYDFADFALNAGFSSGDSNPSDDVYSTFSMDRDYNAGSMLFDLHQAATEVATYNLITDPEHAGNPPDGVEFAVTEGAIRQAMYLQPMITYKGLTDWMDVAVGSVMAWQTVPVSSPFISYRNGGVPVNHLGQPTEGYNLGVEVNWALMINHEYDSGLKNGLSIEGAHLLPSDNLGIDETLSMIRIQSNI